MLVLGGLATVTGIVANAAADNLPPDGATLYALGTLGLLGAVYQAGVETKRTLRRLEPELLVTTVPVAAAVAGLFLWVLIRVGLLAALPVAGVAIGLAVGTGAPAVVVSVVLTAGVLVVIAVAVGVAGRLVGRLVGRQVGRAGQYGRGLLVLAVPAVAAAARITSGDEEVTEIAVTLATVAGEFSAIRLLVNLSVVGAGTPVSASPGTLLTGGGVVFAVPLAFLVAVRATDRLWTTEQSTTDRRAGSQSLVDSTPLGRVLPEPTLVVVRGAWLRERRTRQAFLHSMYLFAFLLPVVLVSLLARVPLYVGFVLLLGFGVGFGFATSPVGRRYREFPMVLTAAHGRHLVPGVVTASVVVAVPVVGTGAAAAGLLGATVPEAVGLWVAGVAVCGCTAAVELATGLRVPYDQHVPVPAWLTDVPVYGETGVRPFLRMAGTFLLVAVATSPAFVTSSQILVGEFGTDTWVRTGGFLLATCLAVVVAVVATRFACSRYQSYTIQ